MNVRDDYLEKRKQVIERDQGRCVVCKNDETQFLVLHHKDGKSDGEAGYWKYKNNRIDNLLLVCKSCHVKVFHKTKKIVGTLQFV